MMTCRPDDQEAYESQVAAQKAWLDRKAFDKKWDAERAQQSPPQDASDGAQSKRKFTMIYPDGMDVKGLSYDELFIKLNADDDGFLPVEGVLFLRKGDTGIPDTYKDFDLVRPDDRLALARHYGGRLVADIKGKEHEERKALAEVQRVNRAYYELEASAGTIDHHTYQARERSGDHTCHLAEVEYKEARHQRVLACHELRDWWRGFYAYVAQKEIPSNG